MSWKRLHTYGLGALGKEVVSLIIPACTKMRLSLIVGMRGLHFSLCLFFFLPQSQVLGRLWKKRPLYRKQGIPWLPPLPPPPVWLRPKSIQKGDASTYVFSLPPPSHCPWASQRSKWAGQGSVPDHAEDAFEKLMSRESPLPHHRKQKEEIRPPW